MVICSNVLIFQKALVRETIMATLVQPYCTTVQDSKQLVRKD